MKFKYSLLFFFTTLLCLEAQIKNIDEIESYVIEGFENELFPPSGWSLEFDGEAFWSRQNGISAFGEGNASAKFDIYKAPLGTKQSMVLSINPSEEDDVLIFDHAYASYTGEIDSLFIETINEIDTLYSILAILEGGISGELVTAPPIRISFYPQASEWGTKSYILPIGTTKIRFKAKSSWGNNLFIDNCRVGTILDHDIKVLSIGISNPTLPIAQSPKVTVKNNGNFLESFEISLEILPGNYFSTKTIENLVVGHESQIIFDDWNPEEGTYTIKVFSNLLNDLDKSNDTITITTEVKSISQITNIDAFFRDGQVFVTWNNISNSNAIYTLYKSSVPIASGKQLKEAENLGFVYGNTTKNERLSKLLGTRYLRIDSSSAPLAETQGLFVVTSSEPGEFYYAVTSNYGIEDTTIILDSNSLSVPISEEIMMPKPIWQEYRGIYDIYCHFVSKIGNDLYPPMTSLGSYHFNFAVFKKDISDHAPINFRMHGSEQSFITTTSILKPFGDPSEWTVTIDDFLPGPYSKTHYYGYHEDYDIRSNKNYVPTSGKIINYTSRRIKYIVDWAIKNLPVDSTRTYFTGWSMGAIGSIFNSIMLPDKIAAICAFAPSTNEVYDWYSNILWGPVEINLMTNEGFYRNERLNANVLLEKYELNSMPIMYTFCGRLDNAVGWREKIPFYQTMNTYKHGGFHFWSNTNHTDVFFNSPWKESFPDLSFFTRFRTDLSYPAFSNCSINDNPGDGNSNSGKLVGTINGYLNWKDDIIDSVNNYEITLYIDDLATTDSKLLAKDSCLVDVTLRRLQSFNIPPGATVNWRNEKFNWIFDINYPKIVQSGSFTMADELITIPNVKMYKDSSRITITFNPVGVEDISNIPITFNLSQNYPNPFNPSTTIKYSIPKRSNVTLKVFDLLGSEVVTIINKEQPQGNYDVEFDESELTSGIYFYRLQAGEFVETKKMILIK